MQYIHNPIKLLRAPHCPFPGRQQKSHPKSSAKNTEGDGNFAAIGHPQVW